MKKYLFISLALLSIFGAVGANASCGKCHKGHAHKDHANKDHISTVAWIQEQDRRDNLDADDRYVVLVGKISHKYNDTIYYFNDGTGTIELDSDIKLPIGTPIVVRGRVDQAFLGIGKLEVDVTSWRHVK